FFALASLGAVLVPVNFLLKFKEVEFILNDSGASLLIVGRDLMDLVDPDRKNTPGLREIICLGQDSPPPGLHDYTGLRDAAGSAPPTGPAAGLDDLFILQYTSGTTGFPKGAMHTHGTLLWNSFHQVGDFELNARDVYLCVPGLCWVAGFHDYTLPLLWMGGRVVLVPSGGLEIGSLLDMVQTEEVTKTLLVPTILKQLVDFPDLDRYRTDTLDMILTGAEPVPVSVIQKFNRLLPHTSLLQGYGLSEGPSLAVFLAKKDALRKIGSAGKPCTNCELLIVDENMERVPPGVKGEVIIRSPATMKGYWNRPEATEEAFAGGWLHTGDLAEYDEEGYIYIAGRKKEMFISGGLNVYPAEIENVILKDPRVAEAAVIGIEDERWGEVGCAFIVTRPGQTLEAGEIKALCRRELADYKVPKEYIVREEPLPRTASGKTKKHELAHPKAVRDARQR
ncbi:MAG: AMP-binding protein, partial [Proteobacteria bacterium]|nr:AMP-binding protein [Pseudomonadota bacterium]